MGGSGTAARRADGLPGGAADEDARRLRHRGRTGGAGGGARRARRRRRARASPSSTSRRRPAARCSRCRAAARAARRWRRRPRRAGARLESDATAIAFFPEDDGPPGARGRAGGGDRRRGLLRGSRRDATSTPPAATIRTCPSPTTIAPGIVSARACGRLAFHWGVRPVPPGDACWCWRRPPRPAAPRSRARSPPPGVDDELVELARDTRRRRARDAGGARRRAWARGGHGDDHAGDGSRATRVVTADLVAVATLPAPASELPRQHGAEVRFDPARGGFAVARRRQFRTRRAGVFACGDVTGFARRRRRPPRDRRRRRGARARRDRI